MLNLAFSNKEPVVLQESKTIAADVQYFLSYCTGATDDVDFNQYVNEYLYKVFVSSRAYGSKDKLQYIMQQLVLSLNKLINRQLDEILHHKHFKALESSWRGLSYLTNVEEDYDERLIIKIKLLNISWKEVGKDLTRAIEFDQSSLFKRIYSDEFDTPGGEPFGVLLGDYKITH
nr:type VI secretion system contractile sheath large subunit [Cellvibrionaceae bacterium]